MELILALSALAFADPTEWHGRLSTANAEFEDSAQTWALNDLQRVVLKFTNEELATEAKEAKRGKSQIWAELIAQRGRVAGHEDVLATEVARLKRAQDGYDSEDAEAVDLKHRVDSERQAVLARGGSVSQTFEDLSPEIEQNLAQWLAMWASRSPAQWSDPEAPIAELRQRREDLESSLPPMPSYSGITEFCDAEILIPADAVETRALEARRARAEAEQLSPFLMDQTGKVAQIQDRLEIAKSALARVESRYAAHHRNVGWLDSVSEGLKLASVEGPRDLGIEYLRLREHVSDLQGPIGRAEWCSLHVFGGFSLAFAEDPRARDLLRDAIAADCSELARPYLDGSPTLRGAWADAMMEIAGNTFAVRFHPVSDAQWHIDGQPMPRVGVTTIQLLAGLHRIELYHPDDTSRRTESFDVDTRVDITLEDGHIALYTHPSPGRTLWPLEVLRRN